MREEEFAKFLINDNQINSKDKAVRSRISKARLVEDRFNVNLDQIVKDDKEVYGLLKRIKDELNDSNGAIQNSVRKYYMFVNKTAFPTLSKYEKNNLISR
ncbi:hypothetical protein KZX50_23175 [Bacillus infantis]|jgi:hypothetical protein|uniref:hypothetical protein n=1 Tax=Bacillus infantis TaxID=324767 RepID=UPI002006A9AD|nr:hypothetical protein [Bacillus infantis]MCK6208339.1 hypothetical protein [Bacillus infantis]